VARRTKAAAAVTREQLLDAAERVFRERGVAGSTLAEVAAQAGMTRGAVYWHFRDKSDLYAAMCERATLPLQTMVERAGVSSHADPMAALRELALTALARLAGDARAQAVFDVMFHKTERATGLEAVAERERRERGRCLLQVERVLAQAVEKRQLPADTDTALATRALYAYIEGVMDQWVLDPGAFDLAAAAPALVDTMLAGLREAPPRRVRQTRRPLPRKRPLAAPAKGRAGKA
jgi:TetR/AcrR family transcriptional regulator, acrAB operon repressor